MVLKSINLFYKVAQYGSLLSLLGMVAVVTLQVVARFLLPSAPNWTEELARTFFIYAIAFGAAVGIRQGSFVKIELLKNYFEERAYQKIQWAINGSIVLFSIVMVYYSSLFVGIGAREKSSAMGLNMAVVFSSMVVLMLAIALFSLEQLLQKKPPDQNEKQ